METTEKRFESDIESALLSPPGGYVKGSDKILAEVEKQLGIKCGECTEDGLFSIDSCRCVGACGLAPVMMIGEEVYGKLTPDMVKGILDSYREEK